jgi:hypothetical protein
MLSRQMRYKNGSAVLVIIIIILIVVVGVLGYFYVKNKPVEEISTTSVETSVTPLPSQVPSSLPVSTPLSTPSVASTAVIVFTAEGSFSQSEKDEIYKKVINPYTDYFAELSGQTLLTISIAKNSQANKDVYPYLVNTIFKDGGNGSFLVMKEGVGITWWLPDCLDTCNLSASFKAKYPEIASKVQ